MFRLLKKYTKDATILIVAQRIGTIMNADKIIGVAVSGNVEKKTSQFKIHYSNKGVHIVPFYHD